MIVASNMPMPVGEVVECCVVSDDAKAFIAEQPLYIVRQAGFGEYADYCRECGRETTISYPLEHHYYEVRTD